MDEDDQSGWNLVLRFPDQSHSFAYGFEAGKLWERMAHSKEFEIETLTAAENREMIQRMCIALGWSATVEATEVEGWDQTVLVKTGRTPDRPNPHGLRIVD